MSDPLSIAAGVIGLLTAAAQISTLLIRFTNASRNAPAQARHVLTEVGDISGILSHLQSFLFGTQSINRSRTSLLRVDHTVTILSGCVMTFSELEKILDELETKDIRVFDSMKWARKETEVEAILQRLQNHKASLSLMLNILNGHTIAEAKISVDHLHDLMSRCYEEMSHRVQALELGELQRLIQNNSASDEDLHLDTAFAENTPPGLDPHKGPALENEMVTTGFMEELKRSWVYSRNSAFRSSTFPSDQTSTRWSCLSRLSLSEISNISVINLAISVEEVKNPKRQSQTWSNDPYSSAGIAIQRVLQRDSILISDQSSSPSRLPLPLDELDDEACSVETMTDLLESHDTEQSTGSTKQTISVIEDSKTVQDSSLFPWSLPMCDRDPSKSPFHIATEVQEVGTGVQTPAEFTVLFKAVSLYEFHMDRTRREAGYTYLSYVAGEPFEIIGIKGELWLAKKQNNATCPVGWIWNKHFVKIFKVRPLTNPTSDPASLSEKGDQKL